MTSFNRSDVKNHLRPPFLVKSRLSTPASQPDATGFSDPEPETTEANPTAFSADFVAEHSSPGATQGSSESTGIPTRHQAPATSESARA